MKDTSYCRGCRDDFYNGQNPPGVRQCWMLAKAKVVKRWKLGWWTSPVEPGAFVQIETYNCHHAPGRYALCESLPDHAVDPIRLEGVQKKTGAKNAHR